MDLLDKIDSVLAEKKVDKPKEEHKSPEVTTTDESIHKKEPIINEDLGAQYVDGAVSQNTALMSKLKMKENTGVVTHPSFENPLPIDPNEDLGARYI